MTKKVGVGRAHSKIILIGEHAVVYGYPALSLPLTNIEVTCRILPSDHAWILYEEDTLSMAVFASLEFLGVQEAYIRCEIESMVPEKRGMGSSAAVSIAAIRAVFDYYEQELDRETLEILANRAEMIAHMNPSGLDAKTCLSDHAIKFIKNVGFSEFETNLGAYLLIADTGIYGNTREAIQKVEQLGMTALPYLHQLGKLTTEVEEALKVKDLERIGIAMSEAHLSLKNLGVSCPEADRLVATAQENGALGAKMSGGGLGGCIIALVASEEKAVSLADLLREKGAVNTWIESL
ncbi:mevalonate kinase [Streptococcus sp. IsoGale021]|uniref:mevalonate kinase n=1 Tax=Streptococcus TaxID=1301 RepID=UPI002001B969|nr:MULTISPECIES: mevalonate kinase [Streptococcus]MCY7210057.1 mevalonate kinase [Streptococcus anginosus]MCY7211797.1 mevalonate kinase [Streptococcus anginosus]MCY7226901.1 mevalonate kinase [Streptococcus anginosus]MDQ8694972.1 mevalonate kinase [Streptococcus sp. IsoGale021]MDU5129181.1 mevalonate kinase [Streptococcus anginosus]